MTMQVTKVWWDGEKLMAEPIDPTAIYKDDEPTPVREEEHMRDTIDMAREAGIIHPEMVSNNLKAFEALVRADEREACARVADKYADGPERNYSENIADEIRARGNT